MRVRSSVHPRKSSANLIPDEKGVKRGVLLFEYLVDRANSGESVGISYGDFVAYLHGVEDFLAVTGRDYWQSDTSTVIDVSYRITEAAGGRKRVVRPGLVIQSGMDTFIWRKQRLQKITKRLDASALFDSV